MSRNQKQLLQVWEGKVSEQLNMEKSANALKRQQTPSITTADNL